MIMNIFLIMFRSRQRRDLGSGHHEHGEHHHHHDEHHASENEVDTGDDWKKYLLPPYMPLPVCTVFFFSFFSFCILSLIILRSGGRRWANSIQNVFFILPISSAKQRHGSK